MTRTWVRSVDDHSPRLICPATPRGQHPYLLAVNTPNAKPRVRQVSPLAVVSDCPLNVRQYGRMSASVPVVVERLGTAVRYVQVTDEISQIRAAWPVLEQAVGSMRGRRFIAAFDPLQGWYRACVEIRVEVTDEERALPEMVIPGGPYLRVRLRGDPPEVYDEIAAAYALPESSAHRDDSRPSLERYRRLDEIDVLMPVTGPPSTRSRL